MKVKALINLGYKKKEYKSGEIFEMTAEDYKNVNKKYVELVPEVKVKTETKKEGEVSDGI